MAEKIEKKAEHKLDHGHDNEKAGAKEVILLNPSGMRRSVPISLAKKILRNKTVGFSLIDAGEYAKELEEFLSGSKKK